MGQKFYIIFLIGNDPPPRIFSEREGRQKDFMGTLNVGSAVYPVDQVSKMDLVDLLDPE